MRPSSAKKTRLDELPHTAILEHEKVPDALDLLSE